jgi:HEPN domain-containing protein
MTNRAPDWLRQAEADLKHAQSEGAPTDYYTKRDAEDSLSHAKSILAFCQTEIRKPEPNPELGQENGNADRGESS